MRKIFLLVIIGVLLTSTALAERFENNLMRYGTIDSSGNLHETNIPVNNVSIIGYICTSAGCSSVSGRLWNGNVLTTNGDAIQLVYPTTLASHFGYGVYFYKDGYIPYEVSANWFGTCPSCDPTGPFNDFLTRKDVCFSNINTIQTALSSGVVGVNVSVHSPIGNAGPLSFTPPSLTSQYSANVSVNLEVVKNGSVVFSDKKNILIPFSGDANVNFNVPVTVGSYNLQVFTSTTDAKCINYTSDFENKTIVIPCLTDSDCGGNECLAGTNACSGLSVVAQERTFSCVNPGTSNSYCTNSTRSLQIGMCNDKCDAGKCFGN